MTELVNITLVKPGQYFRFKDSDSVYYCETISVGKNFTEMSGSFESPGAVKKQFTWMQFRNDVHFVIITS